MIVSCHHVGLCLSHGIQCHADDNEEGRAAEVDALYAGNISDEVRKDGYECQEYGTGQGDSGQYFVYVDHGGLSGADAGDEAAIFLHVICQIFDVYGNSRIEVGEDKNEEAVANGIGPGAPSEEVAYCLYPVHMDELCQGDGEHQDGGSKDDGDDAGLVHFQWQVGGVTAIHSASDDALCILDGNSALSFIDFDDHEDHDEGNDEEEQKLERRNGADLEIINDGGNRFRETSYDTAEDDQGNAVANSVFRDFFADPHQQAGAGGEDHDDEKEIQPAVINKSVVDAQGIGHAECLHSCQENGEVSGNFLDFLESFLSVFSPFFESGDDGGKELHNNG